MKSIVEVIYITGVFCCGKGIFLLGYQRVKAILIVWVSRNELAGELVDSTVQKVELSTRVFVHKLCMDRCMGLSTSFTNTKCRKN